MGILVEAQRRHDWLPQAVEQRLREAWAVLHVTINEEKSRRVDLARGETFSFLGCDFRRGKSRRGVWRPWDTPMRKKRTALLRKLKAIFRRYESQPVDRVLDLIHPILRGMGALLCRGGVSPMLWFSQRLGGQEGAAASEACTEPKRLRLEEVE